MEVNKKELQTDVIKLHFFAKLTIFFLTFIMLGYRFIILLSEILG